MLPPDHPLAGVGTTIFAEMGALAAAHGAINLGQGAPDVDGPVEMIEAAANALRAGPNQYAPGDGIPELRRAIAETPSLTFADVVAKLEIARGARPDAAAPLDADMLRSAIDDLRRLPATA